MISAPPPLKLDEAVARVLHKLVVSALMLLKAALGFPTVRGQRERSLHRFTILAGGKKAAVHRMYYILARHGYYNLIFQETRPLRILFNLVNCAYLHFILWKMIQLSSK